MLFISIFQAALPDLNVSGIWIEDDKTVAKGMQTDNSLSFNWIVGVDLKNKKGSHP